MSPNTVIIRGFADGKKHFEDYLSPETVEQNMEAIIESHAERLATEHLHMIEMEFTGLPIEERFFRFGTDPRNMVAPIELTVREMRNATEAKRNACGYCHGTGQICSSCSSSTLICTCGPQQSPQACSGCKGTGEA